MQTIKYHSPVLLNESIEGLKINPGGVYVDATFGGGGHSRVILDKLNQKGRLFAFDHDPDALQNVPDDKRLIFLRQNFRYIRNNLRYHGYEKVDGIIADLGVSSHQFDEQARGFSFRLESDLDMRMNRESGITAAEILNKYPEEKLKVIFKEYGEVDNAAKLSAYIINARSSVKFENTGQFVSVISNLIPKKLENQYLAKVYQALRIEVNAELHSLKQLLIDSIEVLNTGGRLVIISYHSLEDRLVKNFIKTGNFEGKTERDFYGNVHTPFKLVNNKVIVPKEEEIKQNNRARSAKLRIAEKK